MILFSFIFIVSFFISLFGGIATALFAIFFIPLLTVLTLAIIRILTEVFIAILILPHQLFVIISELKRLRLLIEQKGGLIPLQQVANASANIPRVHPQQYSYAEINFDHDSQSPMIVQVSPPSAQKQIR